MRFIILKNTCLLLLLSSSLFFFVSCETEEVTELSNIPEIELISMSRDTIIEFEQFLDVVISYKDGDGDIGFEQSNQNALFVRDIRLDEFDGFYIGPVLPPDVFAPVVGTFSIDFPDLFVFGNAQSEVTQFEIKLVDRANNESNIILTPEVLILKP